MAEKVGVPARDVGFGNLHGDGIADGVALVALVGDCDVAGNVPLETCGSAVGAIGGRHCGLPGAALGQRAGDSSCAGYLSSGQRGGRLTE